MALPPKTFDRARIARHLRRRPAGHDDFVTRLAIADLEDRLLTVTRIFSKALILAPDAAALPESGESAKAPFAYQRLSTALEDLDPEALMLPREDYDLIVSLFDLQIVNDVPGFLARIRAHLAPDGLFLGAALGGDSLSELRHAFLTADAEISGGAFARVAPFIPLSDAGGLLQRAGFALPVADVETHVVRYASPLALMRELKALGAQNPLFDRPERLVTPRLLAAASGTYSQIASDADGRVSATLEIIWFSGWAPDASQQQPLKPGSAEISLSKVLGKKL